MARHAHQLTIVAAALMLLCWSESCLAYLHPTLGRFVSRDPAGYVDGMGVYQYARSRPVSVVDTAGLWGIDVHNSGNSLGSTVKWATDDVGFPQQAASAIGAADAAVDEGATSPVYGDQSWHFGGNRGRGQDTRLQHYNEQFEEAVKKCWWGGTLHNDDPEAAAAALGKGLHAYQDWVAHGDYGFNAPGRIIEVHNNTSPQLNLRATYGAVDSYPDDPRLDAGGPMGRASGAAIIVEQQAYGTPSGEVLVTREYAIYAPGNQRINATKGLTVMSLVRFRASVREHGRPHCRCWEYFGIRE